ncbi:MAG TPA: hypothetical protein VI111_09725, partial [Thermoleophilaceae bacterium]
MAPHRRVTAFACAALLAAGIAGALPGASAARSCADRAAFPGEAATHEAIAQWMAYGAGAAGLPGELPVMGALVESNLTNLDGGDADTAGYFQIRKAIWNTGPYAGFPDDPPLQLRWFVDQAAAVKQQRIAQGKPLDPSAYGEWVADVEQPAAQYRYRYQLRLDEARELIGPPCADPLPPEGPGPTPPPGDPSVADDTAPALRLGPPSGAKALAKRGVTVTASCPAEACTLQARGNVSLPRAARVYRATSAKRAAAEGVRITLR